MQSLFGLPNVGHVRNQAPSLVEAVPSLDAAGKIADALDITLDTLAGKNSGSAAFDRRMNKVKNKTSPS